MSGTSKGHQARRPRVWWLRPLAVAALYYGVGRLVWAVTDDPGHAAPLWPPAGITLALMLLLRDLSLSTGAVLGAFALVLQAFLARQTGLGPWTLSAVAAVVGVAAAVEPLTAALLGRRALGRLPAGLGSARSILRFALLAGPGPAALGAAIATGALFWVGLIPLAQLPREAALWWAGDTLGLVVFGPLGILVGARLADVHWRRRVIVAVPVVLVSALAVALYLRASRWDQRRGDAVVRERGDALAGSVERSLVYNMDALRTAADYLGSTRVDPETFRRVATGTVVRHFAFTALAWAPAPLDEKPVTVELVDPASTDPHIGGTNLAAEPARQGRLSAARSSGEPVLFDAADPRLVWVFVPAPGKNGDNGVSGFVGGLLRLDLLVERAVSGMDRHGIGLELREDGATTSLYRLPPRGVDAGAQLLALPGRSRIAIGERAFSLTTVVGPATLAVERSGEAWIVLVAGMLLAALLQGVLLVATGGGGYDETEDTLVEEWPASYSAKAEARSPLRR